jgi:hypothetical protein
MSRHEHAGLGNVAQALSKKVEEMQREIAGLRQDVRTLIFLIRERGAEVNEDGLPGEQQDEG